MKKLFRYRKSICLVMLISTFFLYFPLSPARAVMLDTQYAINQDSERFSARARVKAFLGRADVMARMQAYGINPTEALSQVDSLTDCEITSIAGKIDRMPAGAGGTYTLDGSLLMFIGMALYAIIAAIVIYFSFNQEKEEKP
ncbi:MAG: PA2779 family protein [Desulfobacterales bacterium]